MCTLIALHRCVDGAGLVVAANRDEYYARPSEGPALRQTPSGAVLAPLDARAGGTWFGLNVHGAFAALTNRPCPEPDPTRRSRGHVVFEALAAGSAQEAARVLERLPAGAHNPFNAFVADARDAYALVYDERPRLAPLAPGAHVIGNADPDARDDAKVGRVLARAEAAAAGAPEAVLPALAQACREHGCGGPRGALDDTCVHLSTYGTRSSLLLSLGATPQLLHADGPPCEADYQDFTELLSELTQRAGYGAERHDARMVP